MNTEYRSEKGAGGQIRLTLHNVYGPIDGLTLSVQLSPDKSAPGSEWRDLKPVANTVEVEGEMISRAELTEPVYGEAPWEANYELSLDKADDSNVLWIRLDHKKREATVWGARPLGVRKELIYDLNVIEQLQKAGSADRAGDV